MEETKKIIIDAQNKLSRDIEKLLKDFNEETGMYVKNISQNYINFTDIGHISQSGLYIEYIISNNLLED